MTNTFDPRCYELAEWFLDDCDPKSTEKQICSLASTIQQAIEDWMEDQDAGWENAHE